MECWLIVMARYPRAGRGKTRLAAGVGERAAADLSKAFLLDLRARLEGDPRWRLAWAYEPPEAPFAAELGRGGEAFPQVEGDLGRRMEGAFEEGFRRGARRIVLVGSDLPHLDLAQVERAFSLLASGADLVLGPSRDGGYYLIAAREVPPVLRGVAWGGSSVLEDTLETARRAGLEPLLLSEAYDIDDAGDLARLEGDLEAGRVPELPETRRVLRRLRHMDV